MIARRLDHSAAEERGGCRPFSEFFVPCRHHPVRPIEMASRGFAGALRFLYRIDAEDLLRHLLIAGIISGRIQEPQVQRVVLLIVRGQAVGTMALLPGLPVSFRLSWQFGTPSLFQWDIPSTG